MEYKYELLLESERIASVVREHKELHPPYTEECPICLEDTPFRSEHSMAWFLCCGNSLCANCLKAEGGRLLMVNVHFVELDSPKTTTKLEINTSTSCDMQLMVDLGHRLTSEKSTCMVQMVTQ